jgi:hypothetical protein
MRRLTKFASALAVFGISMLSPVARARDRGMGLDEILRTLQTNLESYDKNLPSLFCDEHAVSEMFPGTRRDVTVTDSVFRLKRVEGADHSTSFEESRELKSVNSGPATSPSPDPPAVIDGVFEGALAVVSASQQGCMVYELRKPKDGAILLHFKTADHPARPKDCILQEKAHGRATIDAATLQIKRFEMTAPRHIIRDDRSQWVLPLKGEWVVSVDYAPVVLDARTFWLPAAIHSRVTSDPNSFHSRTWIFKGTYTNFHKLEVTSRVLPSN